MPTIYLKYFSRRQNALESVPFSRRERFASPAGRVLSKDKLRAELADPGITRGGHSTELATADVPARVIELGVIEDIKKFGSDLKSH